MLNFHSYNSISELPDWIDSVTDFIDWHRGILESDAVSKQLHSWIDLTFGYKLSGQAAVRNKNVCLDLSETSREFRQHGVVQLFVQPHPPKLAAKPTKFSILKFLQEMPLDLDIEDGEVEEAVFENDKLKDPRAILLPPEYNPAADLLSLENLHGFVSKTDVQSFRDRPHPRKTLMGNSNYELKVMPMQLLGCLICELFFPKKFRGLGDEPAFATRYRNAVELVRREEKSIHLTIRGLLRRLLFAKDEATKSENFALNSSDRYPVISESGLPLPSAELILDPVLGAYFPQIFFPIAQTLSAIKYIDREVSYMEGEGDTAAAAATSTVVAEFQVKLVARRIAPLLETAGPDIIDLVIPLYISLIESPSTAVLASWYLLDSIASNIGPDRTKQFFLEPILMHYKNLQTTKHIKLYHRSFMLILMNRLRMSVFLESFSNILIEAAGGNREYPDTPAASPSTNATVHDHHEEEDRRSMTADVCEVFSFDSWDSVGQGSSKTGSAINADTLSSVVNSLKHTSNDMVDVMAPVPFCPTTAAEEILPSQGGRKENSVVQVSKETLLWLIHRLGPVLTASHISRNLLRHFDCVI